MPQPMKPANAVTGNKISKSDLEKIDAIEQQFALNNSDDLEIIPDELLDDEIAIQYYGYLLREIRRMKLPITNVDKPFLIECAFCLSHIRESKIDMNRYGLVEDKTDKNGNFLGTQLRAVFRAEAELQKRYAVACNKLGIDPSSRASIARATVNEYNAKTDDTEELFE